MKIFRRLKPVITLDHEGLSHDLRALWARVSVEPIAPDGIVGIETGGFICAKILTQELTLPLFSCALRRPSTAAKSTAIARRVLAKLPYTVSNLLRSFEDWSLERNSASARGTGPARAIKANAVLAAHIVEINTQVRAQGLRHLIVLDDAIDSGITLSVVVTALRDVLPEETRITSAVLTQTRPDPVFKPDVALYYCTLCRFPWSFDYRGTV
jgi:uncharacterized protein